MRWILLLALVASCAKKKEQPVAAETENAAKTESTPKAESAAKTETAPSAGYVPIPDHDLVIQLAPGFGAKPLDDAPGFENGDGTFRLTVRELNSSDPATVEEAKTRLRRTIKDVLHEENTPDGYILTFTMTKTEMVEDSTGRVTRDESGVEYNLQLRRAVDGQPYKCAVTVATKDMLAPAIDACKSIKKKS
ncbi:MAG: hypothetical protein HOV81_01435 [Kofleriaceae bacterium]|nr:hypothetical protein [Kofleriaceae bacterium]